MMSYQSIGVLEYEGGLVRLAIIAGTNRYKRAVTCGNRAETGTLPIAAGLLCPEHSYYFCYQSQSYSIENFVICRTISRLPVADRETIIRYTSFISNRPFNSAPVYDVFIASIVFIYASGIGKARLITNKRALKMYGIFIATLKPRVLSLRKEVIIPRKKKSTR